MNYPSVGNRGARYVGAIAVAMAATLVALVAVFVLAKPSGAQTVPTDPPVTLTVGVNPVEVDFGTVFVDDRVEGHIVTRQITLTNDGPDPITIDKVAFISATAGEVIDFSTNLGEDGLTIESGGANTLEVSFDPSVAGTRDAVLMFTEGKVDGTIADVIRVVDENGNEVKGIDLTGTGNPALPAGATSNCTKIGTNGADNMRGTAGKDVICALGGNDKVSALGGNDKVLGGGGVDMLNAGAGVDVVKGGSSGDRMTGSRGNDRLLGGNGNDVIKDKAGTDKLYGQAGRDSLVAKDGKRGDLLVGGPKKDKVVKDAKDTARSV